MVAACFFTLLATAAPSAFIVEEPMAWTTKMSRRLHAAVLEKSWGRRLQSAISAAPWLTSAYNNSRAFAACSGVRAGPFLPKPPADRTRVQRAVLYAQWDMQRLSCVLRHRGHVSGHDQ